MGIFNLFHKKPKEKEKPKEHAPLFTPKIGAVKDYDKVPKAEKKANTTQAPVQTPINPAIKAWKEAWPEETHKTQSASNRIRRAQQANLIPDSIDRNTFHGYFTGSKGKYEVTLNSCTCPDFANTQLPCKHIYKLALELGAMDRVKELEEEPVGEIKRFEFPPVNEGRGKFLTYPVTNPEPPTERQMAYVRDLGIIIHPEDERYLTKRDVSCMLSRALGDDSMERPWSHTIALAQRLGWKGSSYIGAKALWENIVYNGNDRNTAALYAYAVRQDAWGLGIRNMFEDRDVDKFFGFADVAIQDPALMKSIKGRAPSDYLKPNKGTKAYKAAADYLHIH